MTKQDAEILKKFADSLGIKFKNLEILKQALTHRSYTNELKGTNFTHNERLEYLGDAVLELLISEFLYYSFPNKNEGDLTSYRAATVRTESLFEEAKRINLGEMLYMSKGEEMTGGRNRPYILANAFEALIGAIYIENGIECTKKFLEKQLFYKVKSIVQKKLYIDAKSRLQELSQEVLKETPTYKIIDECGPDHDKSFTSSVLIKGKDMGHGSGKTKQEAEQNAAQDALVKWKKNLFHYFNID